MRIWMSASEFRELEGVKLRQPKANTHKRRDTLVIGPGLGPGLRRGRGLSIAQ